MAKTLLETIQGNLTGQAQPDAQTQDQTGQVQRLLRGKSGQAVTPGSGPKQSSIKERMAHQQTQLGQKQIQQQGRVQAAGLGEQAADIQQRQKQQKQSFSQNRNLMQDKFDRQAFSLLNQVQRGRDRLDTQKKVSALEQIGFLTRLRNDQYVHQIQMEGDKSRLDSDIQYKRQALQDAMKDQLDLFQSDQQFQRMVNQTTRQFAQDIANIDINHALQVGENAIKAANQRMTYQGAGDLLSAGLETWDTYSGSSADPDVSPDTAPTPKASQVSGQNQSPKNWWE